MSTPGGEPSPPSLSLEDLVSFLDSYLEVGEFRDYGPNGLQVEGRGEIRKVATGVSACLELFERANELGADTILVHHGLFWDGQPAALKGPAYRRLATLIRSGVSLLAYHLPLDAHPVVGNNALAARALGLTELVPFGTAKGRPVGYRGILSQPIEISDLTARCAALFGQTPLELGGRSAPITSVGIVSGGGQACFHEAIALGLDAFVTGEASEWVTNLARESELAYLAAGHHATERLGIRALGDLVGDRFGLKVEHLEVPNPV